jgi:hypothetical protein
MNDDNVVSLRLPKVDPDLIESLRTMLSEAQNGRLKAFACVYTTDTEEIATVFHFNSALEAAGAIAMLQNDALACLTE